MMIPNLWSRSRRTSGSSRPLVSVAPAPAPVLVPFIPPSVADPRKLSSSRQRPKSKTPKYDTDSEIPSNRRVYASAQPVIPTSITPHPSDRPRGREGRSSGRRGSESSEASSRSGLSASGQPLRSCLKQATAYPTIAHGNPPPNALGTAPAPGWTPSMMMNPPPEHVYYPPGMAPPQPTAYYGASQEAKSAYAKAHVPQTPASAPVNQTTPFIPPPSSHRRSRRESAPVGYTPAAATSTGRQPLRRGSSASESSNDPAPARVVARPSRGLAPPQGPVSGEKIALHWMLSNRFREDRRTPAIYFDIAFNPNSMRNLMGHVFDPQSGREVLEPVPPVFLWQEAFTHYTMPQMIIHCPRGALGPSPIMIENTDGLKVDDVFKELYKSYNRIISADDMLQLGERERVRCSRHFRKRCEDVPWETELEESIGMRYVDLLRGSRRRIFKGITQRPGNGLSFQLQFEDAE